MRESTIEKAVVGYAKEKGCLVIKNAMPGHRGIPDRLFCYKGRVLWMELKRPGEKPTLLQCKWLAQLIDHGFNAVWTDNVAKGIEAIDKHLLGKS